MDKDVTLFQENVDGWIKDINQKFENVLDLGNEVEQAKENTNHNYELIFELKDEIELLKKELHKLKLIQLVSLSEQVHRKEERKMLQ